MPSGAAAYPYVSLCVCRALTSLWRSSGATGGYTGSYIFSQTIFSLRAKVESRLTGAVIIGLELMIFVMPFSPIAYVPKAFFGSLLVLIAVDLIHEWLLEARHKLAPAEYIVNLLTFVACLTFGVSGGGRRHTHTHCGRTHQVEQGIVVGFVGAMGAFIFSYAQIPAITTSSSCHSNVVRTFEERVYLKRMHHQVRSFPLSLDRRARACQ
jgi:MFS superfamily sulfate permease-like transporter